MVSSSTASDDLVKRVEEALELMKEQLPSVAGVVDAFRPLMIERAAFREELPDGEELAVPDIDPEKFHQGVPVAGEETFRFDKEELEKAAERLIPAMEEGLPKIRPLLSAIRRGMEDGSLDLALLAAQVLKSDREALEGTAASLEVEPALLEFVVGQLMRPLAEKKAQRITPLPEELQWLKGYCPICGSWPSLTYLEGEGGKRWLKCSFCSHEWRFMRTQCPFCENTDFDQMEYYYAEDRESERVEVCHACRRYIVGIDLRKLDYEAVLDVVPIGLIYLDVLAQRHGFTPGATTEWNVFEKPSK